MIPWIYWPLIILTNQDKTMDFYDLAVIIPDPVWGITVTDIASLLRNMDDAKTIDELLTNSGFDSSIGNEPETILTIIERVRALNNTGNVDAYWNIR